jgi:hypothetical protein
MNSGQVVGVRFPVLALAAFLLALCVAAFAAAPATTAAQSNPEAADQDCSAGNYTCVYGEQPPKNEQGPCMLNKQCNPTVFGGSVTGICEAQGTCRATSVNGQAPEQPGDQQTTKPGGPTGQVLPNETYGPPEFPNTANGPNPNYYFGNPAPVTFPESQTQTELPEIEVGPTPPYSGSPVFNETTGQWESAPPPTGSSEENSLPNNPSALPGTDNVFNETTGQWEAQPPPAGCNFLLDNCGPSAEPPAYPTPELPKNLLASPPQQPGTVLQYNEAEGAQNYQYAYPAQSTFNSGVTWSGPGVEPPDYSSPAPTEPAATLNIFEQLWNWFGSLFR